MATCWSHDLFFFFFSFPCSERGVLGFSAPFPGNSTNDSALTFGVPTLVGAFVTFPAFGAGFVVAAVGAVVVSLDFDKTNDPGSPTRGVSSIYSSPYLERRLKVSAKLLESCTLEDPTSWDLD